MQNTPLQSPAARQRPSAPGTASSSLCLDLHGGRPKGKLAVPESPAAGTLRTAGQIDQPASNQRQHADTTWSHYTRKQKKAPNLQRHTYLDNEVAQRFPPTLNIRGAT